MKRQFEGDIGRNLCVFRMQLGYLEHCVALRKKHNSLQVGYEVVYTKDTEVMYTKMYKSFNEAFTIMKEIIDKI